jgi:hypothetical protein
MDTQQLLIETIERWVDNARVSIRRIQSDFNQDRSDTPIEDAARMADYFAKIEAWEQVLRVLNR